MNGYAYTNIVNVEFIDVHSICIAMVEYEKKLVEDCFSIEKKTGFQNEDFFLFFKHGFVG